MSWDASVARHTGALAWRSVVTTVRLPQAWVPALFFPLVLMAIFTASFGDAPGNIPGFPPVTSYLDFAVSGAIIQGVLIGGTTAGAAFARDIEGGFFDRLIASPVSRVAILTGRLGASVALGLVQALLFVAIAEIFGADVAGGPSGVLVMMGITALLASAVGGLGVFLALRSGSAEAVQGMFPLFFALMFFSSVFFPRETMSGWFRVVADWNPMSYIAEGMRDEVLGGADTSTVLIGVAVAAGAALVTVGASALALRRRLRVAG